MNYAEMSDFEINMAVSKLTGTYRYIESNPEFSKHMGRNYCNSWADAGPIIYSNGISIGIYGYGEWGAGSGSINYVEGTSPLRAAMIVFLMMQGDK